MNRKNSGFTLVEFLVVIAIIAILIALLVPCLEHAVLSARLVTCSNNLKQIGVGAVSYTENYYGFWPHRDCIVQSRNTHNNRGYPNYIQNNVSGPAPHYAMYNDTPQMSEVLDNSLHCPFTEQVDVLSPNDYTKIFSYNLYFGWKLSHKGNSKQLKRITDKYYSYYGTTFKAIAGDSCIETSSYTQSSHPTPSLKLSTTIRNDLQWSRWSGSRYSGAGQTMNFCNIDLSVKSYVYGSEELERVPYKFGITVSNSRWNWIPKAGHE